MSTDVVLISPYMKIFLFKSYRLNPHGNAYIRLEANGDAVLTMCVSNAG
jgi:hypothetical protein